MSPVLAVALAGALSTVGLLLVIVGWRGVPISNTPIPEVEGRRRLPDRLQLRLSLTAVGLLAMWFLTGWPVGSLMIAGLGFATPSFLGAKKRRDLAIREIEAIATWSEQLRDTISSSAGLQEAVAVTARLAPKEIRSAVQDLAIGMRRNDFSDELRRFADVLADPVADEVVVAMILASERRGQNLVRILTDVANAARDSAALRVRVETAHQQTYNDTKVVFVVVAGMFAFLVTFSQQYLEPFNDAMGQMVLGAVGCMWGLALLGIKKLAEIRRPPRLLALDEAERIRLAEGV